jgi:hypothetical protein
MRKFPIFAGGIAGTALALAACAVPAAKPAVTVTVTAPAKTVTVAPKVTTAPPKPTTAPAVTQPPPQQFTNASAVVDQFYQDITDRNYPAAWTLGGDNIGGTNYSQWVLGYDTTASIVIVTANNFGSGQVDAEIAATQDDGSIRDYEGTYTVANGVIVAANIAQI